MKKLFLCLTLTLILIFTASCAKENNDSNSEDSTTEETFSIDMTPVVETEETEPEPEPVYSASFVGVGDNIIYYGNVRDAKSLAVPGGREHNFRAAYSDVEERISSADIAFINQETLMCGEGYEISYYPMFNSPRDLAYDLCDVGFDVVNISNNHMLDKGGDGLGKTIEFWKTMDVTLIGGYLNEEEFFDVPIVETNGIKIAYLSYCEMTNGISLGAKYDLHIPYLNEEHIKKQTESVKDKCDLIVVSVHWGQEGAFSPNEDQKHWAKVFSDNGVDVILGHHPHVVQPVEWIERGDGTRTLCVYSLGNFLAEQAYDYNAVGGMISFDIKKIGNARATVENVLFEPTVIYFPSNFYNNHVYFLSDFTEELANKHGVKTYYGHKLTLEGLKAYVTSTVSKEFLPEEFK